MTTQFNSGTGEVSSSDVVRVSHGQAAESPLQVQHQSTRVAGSTERYSFGGEAPSQAESTGITRYQAGQDSPQGDSIVATLQRDGGRRTVEIEPGNPASRTTIQSALAMGVIREFRPGEYIDAQQPQQGTQKGPEEAAAEGIEQPTNADDAYFKPDEDKAFADDIEPLSQVGFDAAVALATVASLDGTDLSAAARRLASEEGIEPAEAEARVETVYSYFEGAVSRAMEPEGISAADKADFYQWARSKPQQLQNAISLLVSARDMSGWRLLAVQYRGHRAGKS